MFVTERPSSSGELALTFETSVPSASVGENDGDAAKEQIATHNAIISTLKNKTDDAALAMIESSKSQIQQLKISITRSKPLQDQASTLKELVDRKKGNCRRRRRCFTPVPECQRISRERAHRGNQQQRQCATTNGPGR